MIKYTFKLCSLLIGTAFLIGACGPASPNNLDEAAMATAVAQTVEARSTQTGQDTSTPSPKPSSTSSSSTHVQATPTMTLTLVPATASGPVDPCLKANFLADVNYPDDTIVSPGQAFTKTWRIQNNGTCTWDSSYSLVFWDGDQMGALPQNPLPQVVGPGQQVDISIPFTAPSINGTYRSEWKILTKWGGYLGVGEYQSPLYVEIVVSDATKPQYGVTAVTYEVLRDPQYGCATNVKYTIIATVTVNGPVEVDTQWYTSDHETINNKTLTFTEASSKTVSLSWQLHKGATAKDRFAQLIVTSPNYQEFGKATFYFDCQ
jgi:hypothetical protein